MIIKRDGSVIINSAFDAANNSFSSGDTVFFIHPSKRIMCKGTVKDITSRYVYVLCTDVIGDGVNIKNREVRKNHSHVLRYDDKWHSPKDRTPVGDIVFYVGNEKHFGYYSREMESFYSYKTNMWIDQESVKIFSMIHELNSAGMV